MERWLDRFHSASRVSTDLETLAGKIEWDLSPQPHTERCTRVYLRLRIDLKLWQIGRQFVERGPSTHFATVLGPLELTGRAGFSASAEWGPEPASLAQAKQGRCRRAGRATLDGCRVK
jgi:hypothetical protein